MTSNRAATADHQAELELDELVGALYRDVAQWSVEVADLTPYGPAVVQRSVESMIEDHVQRLRGQILHRPRPISRFNAWFFDNVTGYANFIARNHKRAAFADIGAGHVLEIGAGTGANFAFVPRDAVFTALEPNRAMHDRLRRRADRAGIELRLLAAPAESIPLPDESVDTVLISLVLCTVTDPDAVLAEILRVLRPGGTLRFVEHVAARSPWSPRRWLQRAIDRPWSWLFEGCRLCRHTAARIEEAGFRTVEIRRRRFSQSVFVPVNSAIHGWAQK